MKMKKALAIVLSCLLLLGAPVTALAANPLSFDLTINNLKGATEIKLYRVINIDEQTEGKLTYTLNTKYKAVFDEMGIDKVGQLENKEVKDILTGLQKHITDSIAADKTLTVNAGETSVTEQNLDMGYYYITMAGESGTIYNPMLVMVPTSDTSLTPPYKDTVVNAKANKPVPDKQIKEGTLWGDKADADIGDVIEFKITVDVAKYADNVADSDIVFRLTDTMSKGLSWIPNQTCTVTDNANAEIVGALKTPTVSAEGESTKVVFDFDYSKIKEKTSITLSYKAVLNEDAVVGTIGNDNTVILTYTTDPYTKATGDSAPDKTHVYTYGLDVTKAELGNADVVLAGAVFELKKGEDSYYFVNAAGSYTAVSPEVYDFAADGDTFKATPKAGYIGLKELTGLTKTVVSDANGKILINGLDAGDYVLEETKAPDGYFVVNQKINFTITADKAEGQLTGNVATGADTGNEAQTADAYYHKMVFNSTEYILPQTGDMGTIILITAGAVMITVACVMLWVRRRRPEQQS